MCGAGIDSLLVQKFHEDGCAMDADMTQLVNLLEMVMPKELVYPSTLFSAKEIRRIKGCLPDVILSSVSDTVWWSADDSRASILAHREKLNVANWGAAAAVLSVAASDTAAVSAAALEALEGFGFLKHRHEHRSKETRREPPEDLSEEEEQEE